MHIASQTGIEGRHPARGKARIMGRASLGILFQQGQQAVPMLTDQAQQLRRRFSPTR
jgi:hypothetical protein